jgi:hypothetical protein
MINVTAQPYEALLLFHGGALAGLCYLLLRTVRIRCRSRLATHLCDAVFVVVLFVLLAGYLYTANYGMVRGFLLVSFLLGFAAFYMLFSSIFAGISQKIRKK